MKRFLHILAALLAVLTIIGGLDLTGYLQILPEGWAAFVATLPPLALALGHSIIALGDQLDDGQKNGSFPGGVLKLHPLTLLLAAIIAILFTSCAETGWTGTGVTPFGSLTITQPARAVCPAK